MSMGSVSDPGGVSIPPGWTQADITNAINATRAAYNHVLNNLSVRSTQLSSAIAAMASLETTLLEKRAALEADPSDATAQAEYDAALAAFLAGKATFETRRTQYNATLNHALLRADNYASALARQQLFTQNLTTTDMESIVSALLNPPSSEIFSETSLPSFPWISSAIEQTLTEDINQRNTLGLALINAFNAYRYLEYQISEARVVAKEAELAGYSAHYAYIADPTNANLILRQNAAYAISSANAAVTILIGARTSTRNALNNAISNFEGEFQAADDPLLLVISTIQTFVDNYDASIQAIRDQEADLLAFIEEVASQEAAAEEGEHIAAYPTISTDPFGYVQEVVQHAVERYEAITSLSYGRQLSAASIPLLLPPSLGRLSIGQLMKLLSQVQLMLQELIRQTADADRWIRTLRLRVSIQSLAFYTAYLQATDFWAQQVSQADAAYDVSVEGYNINLYERISFAHGVWSDNITLINQIIEEINAEIEEYNTSVSSLIGGANTIREDLVDAINAIAEDFPNAPNVLDILGFDTDIPPQTTIPTLPTIDYPDEIPPFDTVALSDIPNLPYNTLPVALELPADPITTFNDQITNLLIEIAPFKDLIIARLSEETGIDPVRLELSPLHFREMIGVRDNRTQLGIFESIVTALVGMLIQLFLLIRIGIPPSPEEVEQLISEVAGLFSTTEAPELAQSPTSPAVSFALGMMGLDVSKTVSIAINTIIGSTLFTNAFAETLERIGILAGLQVAGIVPDILQNPLVGGVSIREILQEKGIDISQIIDQENTQALLFAFAEQLALTATDMTSLRNNTIGMLEVFPNLELSTEELQELIDILIALQQTLLLLIAVLMGLEAGATTGELIALIFGPAADEEVALAREFEALGIPLARARELAALVVGRDELQTLLVDLGLEPQTTTILLAIIAAAQGGISLTEGVPGGRAFYDALIALLKKAGIAITAPIEDPGFLPQLLAQLEAITSTEEQRKLLGRLLLDPTFVAPLVAPIADRITEYLGAFPAGLEGLLAEPVTPITLPEAVTPSFIFDQFVERFALLPQEIKAEIIAIAEKLGLKGPSAEQAAALLLAIRLGLVSADDASLLLILYNRELKGQLSDVETEIIRGLFAPREEDLRLREERRRSDILTDETMRPHYRPSVVPISTVVKLQKAFRIVFRNYDDANFAKGVFERFTTTVENLHDFNSVVLDLLLNPGRSILKNFSLISRSGHDAREQPQIFFGG